MDQLILRFRARPIRAYATGILFFFLSGQAKASGVEPAPPAATQASDGQGKREASKSSTDVSGATGVASWYGDPFHGRRTASGEVYDMHKFTAAHPDLPLGTRAKVTNLKNDRSVVVDINDRGPYIKGRILDLSMAAARWIGMIESGITRVRIEILPAE